MIRFVLIVSTFGFLSLAWYQMSGGANFEPGTQTAGLPSLTFPDGNAAAAPEVARGDISGADLTSLRNRHRAYLTQQQRQKPAAADILDPPCFEAVCVGIFKNRE